MIARAVTCAIGLSLTIAACGRTGPNLSDGVELAKTPTVPTAVEKRPLSEIDLSQIGHIAPKGRVQDKEYNNLVIIDQLLATGKDAIPFL